MEQIPESVIEKQIEKLKENIDFESEQKARESATAYIKYLIEQVTAIDGTIHWPEDKQPDASKDAESTHDTE